MPRRTEVYGPAYLDRVLRIDRPLLAPGLGPPLDQSVEGRGEFTQSREDGLTLHDPNGPEIQIALPETWPGPWGVIRLNHGLSANPTAWKHAVQGVAWQDDLGGMGAGFAAAFGGRLVSALGPEEEPISRAVEALLVRAGIMHQALRVVGHTADWTLLVTSGAYGDKLPVGFRGCHASVAELPVEAFSACGLRVVSSFPNRLVAQALLAPGATVRMFAPALRNMVDRCPSVGEFAGAIDILCCNRTEWESLEDREEVAWRVALLAITDGPNGSTVRFTTPEGEPGLLRVDAFPRVHPPRDTNRAGEAYAATLVSTLLDHGWCSGVTEPSLARLAAQRASAAAALEVDLLDFGFPTPEAIDDALRAGRVE